MATAANITPIKLGVKFHPPALILIYNEKSKLRKRAIPVKSFDLLTNIQLHVEKFKLSPKYRKYFEKIQNLKIEKMFFILQDNMKGYTLEESKRRAEKYEDSKNTDVDLTELTTENVVRETLNKKYSTNFNNTYDDDDFHDTEDESEDEKNPPSVSTISDVKAKHEVNANAAVKPTSVFSTLTLSASMKESEKQTPTTTTMLSRSSALDLLSNNLQSVKTKLYDFEDEVEDEEIEQEEENEREDEDNDNILNFVSMGKANKEDTKIETAFGDGHDDSSSSF